MKHFLSADDLLIDQKKKTLSILMILMKNER